MTWQNSEKGTTPVIFSAALMLMATYIPTKVQMSWNLLDDSLSLTVPGMLEL